MNDASVVMPCYNRGYNIYNVLNAYDQQVGGIKFTLIAIDDASTDDTVKYLKNYSPQNYNLIVKQNTINSGPAFSRNSGLEEATSPITIIVGDDVVPEDNFVQKHLQLHEYYSHKGFAILGHVQWPEDMPVNTLMRHIDGLGAEQFSYYYLRDGQEYDFRHFYTANISLKRSLLTTVNTWFDTSFPLAAFEDVEFAYRLKEAGLKIIYSSAPVVKHYHYHTIWTFSKRQYNAGKMACILEQKHPGALGNKSRKLKQIGSFLDVLLRTRSIFGKPLEDVREIESRALQLASFYEWHSNQLLDWLYIKVLDYFWTKGLIEGSLANQRVSGMMVEWYANRHLLRAINNFIDKARPLKIPTPF